MTTTVVSCPVISATRDAPSRVRFAEMLAAGAITSLFQPIVDLSTGQVVAHEALARGPVGAWHRPDHLFDAARELGLLAETDEACRVSALDSAVRLGITSESTVFINVEPEILDLHSLTSLAARLPAQTDPGRIVLEVTERALARRPAHLMRAVELVRSMGWGIALDDVGIDPASLAFLSLLEPDVVKLDMSLIQENMSGAAAHVMHCVNAYAERSGALVLAEGIETPQHLDNARALGATLGQGWLFGRPTPAPLSPTAMTPSVRHARGTARTRHEIIPSPFNALPEHTPLRRAPKRLLIELSKNLEHEAARIGETCVVAATFQHARHFTHSTRRRYRSLAEQTGFVCVLGEQLDLLSLPGVRSADLPYSDPVRLEWDIVVLSPHFAAALLARDDGSTGPEMEREFEFALTYDRTTVVQAGRALLGRVAGSS